MERNIQKDECLEKLWYMKEKDLTSFEDFKINMGDDFDAGIVEDFIQEGVVLLTDNGDGIKLTDDGEKLGRQLIRSHRLAERLVYDVLGGEFEAGACEFEHIANPGLVDSICTLLGHPRECPHGMPIPLGSCCKKSLQTTESSVMRLTDMNVGQAARIAYINCQNDKRLHRLEGLQIRPGMTLKLHQKSPTTVIECEGANIALDESVCADIRLWKDKTDLPHNNAEDLHAEISPTQKRGRLFSLKFFRR